jgi:hypothetical protein
MALAHTDLHGNTTLVFGFAASDAPSIAGFLARSVSTSDATPEVFVTATNGEGHVEAVAVSKSANKMISATFTGYITTSFNKLTVGNTFSFLGRFFIIKKISDPRPKGEYVEASIDAESYPLVTA